MDTDKTTMVEELVRRIERLEQIVDALLQQQVPLSYRGRVRIEFDPRHMPPAGNVEQGPI